MKRRDFLQSTVAALVASSSRRVAAVDAQERVVTVSGEIAANQLGTVLPHEHILVDFVGAEKVSPERYDAGEVFRVMLPYLEHAREAGCQALAECTPAYLGRDPKLLKRLSEASGVKLLTNTGYYGARQGKFLPQHAFRENAVELAVAGSRNGKTAWPAPMSGRDSSRSE